MSGTKTSRADLKNRFKKGMYPTEGDFANVFESYVHKDDDISMSKVVLTDGDGNTTTLNNVIGNKADKTDLTEITNRLTTAENDIDTAEDNIAGHETRIKSLEAFKERVRAFLEDADASEETINRWHEIESFLQGITDTQTLTGLLADLKQEILASIPEPQTGNYLKLIPDLDAYTDAPDGEIVKYTGPTNDKYTRGWDYERVAGDLLTVSVPSGSKYINIQEAPDEYSNLLGVKFYPTGRSIAAIGINAYGIYYYLQDTEPKVGDVVVRYSGYDAPGATITITEINDGVPTLSNGYPTTRTFADTWYEYVSTDGEYILVNIAPDTNLAASTTRIYLSSSPSELVEFKLGFSNVGSGGFSFSLGSTPSFWRLIPSMPVIQ